MIVGLADSATNGGRVQVFLNDGHATQPKLVFGPVLIASAGMGLRGPVGLWYGDLTGDGAADLIYTGPSSNEIRLHLGLGGGAIESTPQQVAYPPGKGGGNTIIASDFTLDGKPDLMVITDNWNYGGDHLGGETYYYVNDGDTTPFSGGMTRQISFHHDPHDAGTLFDSDASTYLDYDNDPDNTLDLVVADGNHAASFFLFANRVVQTYVECGEVSSGLLDLGALADAEMVVTAARISPSHDLNGGSIIYYLSNETPANWQLANPCADDPASLCVSFPKPVGRDVRWKAVMCSDSSHTNSPSIDGMSMVFDFKRAATHYRAGVVVHDGVAYAGGFSQPGHRGYLHATSAALDATYWEASAGLDARADASRALFTATPNGKKRREFSVAEASHLIPSLQATGLAQAEAVVTWARSPRFGVGNTGFPLSRLGAIETSTPAVLSPPGLPAWYAHAAQGARADVDQFVTSHAGRELLVLFGSRDGMVHAVRNDPSSIADAGNGEEAWGFVPASVAARLLGDMTSGQVSAYPDGSPTLADVRLADGALHTVAIIASGNGGKSVFALDVTDTVAGSGAITGPEPLWEVTPGGGNAGQAFSKSVVARVEVDGAERYYAIVGTGVAGDHPNRGRVLFAVDIATGDRAWRFRTACPLTSDIAVFESDDESDPTSPAIDGFHDLVVFADACGHVYKLDPAVDLWKDPGKPANGGWLSSANTGVIDTGANDPNGDPVKALFSVADLAPPVGLGEHRPIVGTIGVRPDSTTRVVLYFGTGGIESYDPSERNQLYAVYADTGELRSVLEGGCNGSGRCEKFYGGVVVSAEQVVVTRSYDPEVGTGLCDAGSSTIQGLALDADTSSNFITQFNQLLGATLMAPLFGHAGAIYSAGLDGTLVRIGAPRAAAAGEDSAAGQGQGTTGEGGTGASGDLQVLGWRHVY